MVLTTFAQEIDDPTEADADAAFFAIGRYYKSISPIINKMHDWKDWETNYDSIAKFQRAEKIQGGQAINFIFEEFTDDNGDPVGDTIEYLQNNLHYLDYDNDGFEDLIFEQKLSYRGHRIKVYRGNGKHYDLAYKFTGMIVAMDRDESNGALHLTIYDYPCCDGYVHVLQSYIPVMNNDTIQYQLNRVDKYVESNVRRLKNLPESFITEESFTTKTEAVVYTELSGRYFKSLNPDQATKTNTRISIPLRFYLKTAKEWSCTRLWDKPIQGMTHWSLSDSREYWTKRIQFAIWLRRILMKVDKVIIRARRIITAG